MITDLVTKDFICTNAEASNWEEAVIISGNLLLNNGYVTQEYVGKMVDMVKEMGPYIVIGKGIALAHARPSDGAIKIGVSFVTLKEPVEFGNEYNDPVSLVIGLCAIDNTSHLDVIADLAGIMGRENIVADMCACQDAESFLDLLESN